MVRRTATGRYIHYEFERTDYTVSEAELEKLRKGEHPLCKDVVLVTIPLGISTLFNGFGEISNQAEFKLTLSIFLNLVIGLLSLMLAIISSIAWYRNKKEFKSVIDRIKGKPRFEVPLGVFDAGALPAPKTNPNQP